MHQTTTTCWPSRSNLTATTHKSNNIPLLLELELGVASKIVYLDNFYIKNNFGNVDHCCCSVIQLCLTLCDPMECSTPGFPVLHYLLEFAQTHVHPVGDAILPCHPLLSPSPPAFSLPQHQGLFQWVGSSHQAKVLELQKQFFQRIFGVDFL